MPVAIRRHILAVLLFPILSFLWVGDTLFLGLDLSAFDIVLRLPHWKAAHEYRGVQQIILSDSPQAHYPERALKWRAARQGERIDFTPYIFTGMPELSQGAGDFITSPFQLFMDVSEAIDWSTWFRLSVAGLLMYTFLVVLELSIPAAVLGGIIWAFNLHQIAWLEFPQHLATQLWIPALFCFNYLILRKGVSWENALGIVVINAFFFTSDYIQIVLFTYVAIGLFNTVYLVADTTKPAAERVRRWLAVHAVFILSAALLVPKLIVEVQQLGEGLRAQQEWRSRVPELGWRLGPALEALKNMMPDIADYKRFFSPNYFGGLWGHRYEGKEYFGNIVVGSTYSGLMVFLMAPIGLLWLRRPERRPFLLASLLVLMFAFGMIHKDAVVTNLFSLIPMSGLGGYERYITIITFLLSVISAAGLHILMTLEPAAARKVFWAVFFIVITSPLWIQVMDPTVTLRKTQYSLAVLASAGAAAALLQYFRLQRLIPTLFIAVAVVDLFLVTYGFNPRMEDHRNFAVTPTLRMLIEDRSPYRVAEVSSRQLYPPNTLQYYGIPSVNGYSTVAPARYLRFVDETIKDYHVTPNGQLFFFENNLDIFRLLNVKYLLSEHRIDDPRVQLARAAPGYWVYELTDPLPRAYCGDAVLHYDAESTLLKDLENAANRYDRPIALADGRREPRRLPTDCRVIDIRANLDGLGFTVSSSKSSYVFVPYNHYSDWRAWSDGEGIPVLRANYNFIALPVAPGTHDIRLLYRDPVNVVFNIVMIGLGAVVICWALFRGDRSFTSWSLGLAAVVLVLWSLLEIPGVANDDLPERPEPSVVLPPAPP